MEVKVEGEQEVSESRLQKLEGRTYHIDGKVAAIETQLGTQGQQLSRIEQHLLAPKPPVNYGVWVGIGITVLFGFGSLMIAVTGYVDIQLGHIKGAMADLTHNQELHQEHRVSDVEEDKETAFLRGRMSGELDAISELVLHMDQRRHVADTRIQELEKAAAAGKVSRQAIGDYAKEIARKIQ